MKKNIKKITLIMMILVLSISSVACSNAGKEKSDISGEENKQIKLGGMAITEPILEWLEEDFEGLGYEVEIVLFDGNHLPATALKEGNVDGIILNHLEWLKTFNKENDCDLRMPEPYMYYSRNAIYSSKYNNLDEIPDGAKIAVPGDPTNMDMSLKLLEELNFIKLGEKAGNFYTVADIEENYKNIEIIETEITATVRSIDDVDAMTSRASHVKEVGLDPNKFLYEDLSVRDIPLGLIVDAKDLESEWVKEALKISQTDEFKEKFNEHYDGTYVLFDN